MFTYDTDIDSLPQLSWSESLARAARHVLNEEGSCGTSGSHYGESFEEALRKYYTYEVDNLDYLVLESVHFAGEYDIDINGEVDYYSPVDTNFAGFKALNYIFSQNSIDPSIFFS